LLIAQCSWCRLLFTRTLAQPASPILPPGARDFLRLQSRVVFAAACEDFLATSTQNFDIPDFDEYARILSFAFSAPWSLDVLGGHSHLVLHSACCCHCYNQDLQFLLYNPGNLHDLLPLVLG
jgi:hypothetical protein